MIQKPLIELTRICEYNGYDAQPVREGKLLRFVIWKNDQIFKIGKIKYKTLLEGQRDVYNKIYLLLVRENANKL